MGGAPIAFRKPLLARVQRNRCGFVAHQHLGLHAADAGKRGELVEQIAEQLAAAPLFQDLIDGLEGHVLLELLLAAGITDASRLGAAHDA